MCSFQGVSSALETDKYLVIAEAIEDKQHTVTFSIVSNTGLQSGEFDRFHEARMDASEAQISKREVRRHSFSLLKDSAGCLLCGLDWIVHPPLPQPTVTNGSAPAHAHCDLELLGCLEDAYCTIVLPHCRC